MQTYLNYNLSNSFNLPCKVQQIFFPENFEELFNIRQQYPTIPIIADTTNIILQPKIDKLICLRKMPNDIFCLEGTSFETNIFAFANSKLIDLINYSIKLNLTGFEGLWGIPGSIGGAIYGNSGSGIYTISDYLTCIMTWNDKEGLQFFEKDQLTFKRRYSNLQETNNIILYAIFTLPNQSFDNEQLKWVKNYRKTLPKYPSIGGIFKNWYSLKPYEKELINLSCGDAIVSNKVNIIINKGHATFQDVMNLIEKIKTIVKEPLELEAKII